MAAKLEKGVDWAGFHTFRHTVASRMFDPGGNAAQIQHRLGSLGPFVGEREEAPLGARANRR
jgi:hypothetical protein